MGNSKSTALKELYGKQRCEILQAENDKRIGEFKVIGFQNFRDEIFILKVLDPSIYDEYADTNEFTHRLSQSCPAICDFHFIQVNSLNNELYDMIYEFGFPVKECLVKEKHLWRFVEQTLAGLLFMESAGLHYPVVSKRYIARIDKKTTKLMNPYCFPDFIKEVLQIYLNPQNPVSKRRNYAMSQIATNVSDFGILLCSMVAPVSEYELRTDPKYVFQFLETYGKQISPKYAKLIWFILLNSRPPKSFFEIREFIQRTGTGPSAPVQTRPEAQSIDMSNTTGVNLAKNTPKGPLANEVPSMPDKFSLGSMAKSGTLSTQDRDSMANTSTLSQKTPLQNSSTVKSKVRIFEDFPAERSTPNRSRGATPTKLQNTVIAQPNLNLKESVNLAQNYQGYPLAQPGFNPNAPKPNDQPPRPPISPNQLEPLPNVPGQMPRQAPPMPNPQFAPQQQMNPQPLPFNDGPPDANFFSNPSFKIPPPMNQFTVQPDPSTPMMKGNQSSQEMKANPEPPRQMTKQSAQLEMPQIQSDFNQGGWPNLQSPAPMDQQKLAQFQTPDIKEFAYGQMMGQSSRNLATPDFTTANVERQSNRNAFSQKKIDNPLNFNLRATSFSNAKVSNPNTELSQNQEQRFAQKSISTPPPFNEMAQQPNIQSQPVPPSPINQNLLQGQPNLISGPPPNSLVINIPPSIPVQGGLTSQQTGPLFNSNPNTSCQTLYQSQPSLPQEYSLFDTDMSLQENSAFPPIKSSHSTTERLFATAPIELMSEVKQNPDLNDSLPSKQIPLYESAPPEEERELPLQKRASLISDDAIVPPVMPEFAFINSHPHKGINMNSYLQLHDKTSTQPLDISPYFSDEKQRIGFFADDNSTGQTFNPYSQPISDFNFNGQAKQEVNPEKTGLDSHDTVGLEVIPIEVQSIPPLNQNDSSQPSSQKEITPLAPEVKTQDVPPAPQTNKKIKRVIHRWISAENRHQKIIEYEDGTSEEMTPAENDDITRNYFSGSQLNNSQNRPQSNSNPNLANVAPQPPVNAPPTNDQQSGGQPSNPVPFEKTSHINFYNIPESKPITNSMRDLDSQTMNNLHFVLIPDNGMPAILLFKPKTMIQNSRFQGMAQIVTGNHVACPSMYHQIEDDFVKQTPPNAFATVSPSPAKPIPKEEPLRIQPKPYQQIPPTVLQNPVILPISVGGGPINMPPQMMMPQPPINRATPSTVLSSNARIIRRV
jgi:hypothetical protein